LDTTAKLNKGCVRLSCKVGLATLLTFPFLSTAPIKSEGPFERRKKLRSASFSMFYFSIAAVTYSNFTQAIGQAVMNDLQAQRESLLRSKNAVQETNSDLGASCC
jgi:hypothetical protein